LTASVPAGADYAPSVATEPSTPVADETSKPVDGGAPKPGLVERLQQQRDRHRDRHKAVRALYVVTGFTVLVAGIIMLITPGPAFVVIPIGLAMLSLEFAWAEQLLGTALEKGEQAKRKAAETTKAQRVLTAIAVLCGCLAVLAWGMLGDIPVAPI
jgi:uncharacterized protein (TIGR02611 family)